MLQPWDAWLAQSVKYATLELKVMNSHPTVDTEII